MSTAEGEQSTRVDTNTKLTPASEWEFIQGLPYLAQTGEDAEFVRMMYTVRLKKVRIVSIDLSSPVLIQTQHRSRITTKWRRLGNA